jgi:CRP-like cAMP-binding protein
VNDQQVSPQSNRSKEEAIRANVGGTRQLLCSGPDRSDATQTLWKTGIFHRLEPHAASELMRQVEPIDFGSGHVVFAQEDPGDRLYVIISGKVKMSHRSPHGYEHVVTVMGPSDMFGEVSIFDYGTRIYTATAVTRVHALSLNRATVQRWIADYPTIAEQWLRVFARRLELMNNILYDVVFTDVPARVACRLLQLAQRFGSRQDDAVRVTHELDSQEFAQLVGACAATVDNVLREFVQRGWIHIDGTGLVISDSKSLAALQYGDTDGWEQ